ncbi:hypothetical protein HMPREF0658_0640, partial [Hoylesella marshii DSM 16973 = JCM 13450]
DEPHLVKPSSFDWHSYPATITNESGVTVASSVDFVEFEVTKNDIRSGNAVIAVKNEYGITMWSWHLWFAPESALNTIACTNYQGHVYKFTEETLGMKYTAWSSSTYSTPRSIKVKVVQETPNGGTKQEAVFTIMQNPGDMRQGIAAYYQWGRKDAFPGTDDNLEGTFNKNAGDNMSITNGIQHPENFYTDGSSWSSNPPSGYTYYNLWSMDNTGIGFNDNAVFKTIYDPCPAGFKIPASNAFTGFTKTGYPSNQQHEFNVNGGWDNGWIFNNKIISPDATAYFPALGARNYHNGLPETIGAYAYYWSAVPYSSDYGCASNFTQLAIGPLGGFRPFGYAVRPVAE